MCPYTTIYICREREREKERERERDDIDFAHSYFLTTDQQTPTLLNTLEHTHTHTHTHSLTHSRTHSRTHTHTHARASTRENLLAILLMLRYLFSLSNPPTPLPQQIVSKISTYPISFEACHSAPLPLFSFEFYFVGRHSLFKKKDASLLRNTVKSVCLHKQIVHACSSVCVCVRKKNKKSRESMQHCRAHKTTTKIKNFATQARGSEKAAANEQLAVDMQVCNRALIEP